MVRAMSEALAPANPGLSGLSLYVPRPRVALSAFAGWTGADPAKLAAVVGDAFRVPQPEEDVYTMAAAAVLRLLREHDVDPSRVGMLALGTESSVDNAVGAVIVRGMVDDALRQAGRAPLPRDVEVPEVKHACLGGMYALKAALRYVQTDGADRVAIVVAADIAQYERGTKAIYEGAVNTERWLLTYVNANHNAGAPIPPPIETYQYSEALKSYPFVHYADAVWDNVRMNNILDHFATAFFELFVKGQQDRRAYFEKEGADFKGFQPRTSVGLLLDHASPRK